MELGKSRQPSQIGLFGANRVLPDTDFSHQPFDMIRKLLCKAVNQPARGLPVTVRCAGKAGVRLAVL